MGTADLKFDISKLNWINKPEKFEITGRKITFTTEPQTDFWQRTFYGFSNDNGHAQTLPVSENFTFMVKTSFNFKNLYEESGLYAFRLRLLKHHCLLICFCLNQKLELLKAAGNHLFYYHRENQA